MKKFIDQIIITLFFLYLLISKYIIIISYNYSIFIMCYKYKFPSKEKYRTGFIKSSIKFFHFNL